MKQSTSHIKLGDRTCSTRARKDRITDTPNDMITTKEGDAVGMVASDQERTDLMEERMQQPLDIDEIAKAAYSSPFHFQRMFHMLTGVTVAEYVRKRRLTLAAQELSLSSAKVLNVAFKYGYDSPESFSKAFEGYTVFRPLRPEALG